VSTGECLRTFKGHINSVESVSFSNDDKFFISGSADYTLELWYESSGECVRTFEGHTRNINSVSLSN
jgi:WD40 repeat protein